MRAWGHGAGPQCATPLKDNKAHFYTWFVCTHIYTHTCIQIRAHAKVLNSLIRKSSDAKADNAVEVATLREDEMNAKRCATCTVYIHVIRHS
jgi:hypothetical protein